MKSKIFSVFVVLAVMLGMNFALATVTETTAATEMLSGNTAIIADSAKVAMVGFGLDQNASETLNSVVFTVTRQAGTVTSSDFDGVYIYRDSTDDNGFDSSTDTLVGTNSNVNLGSSTSVTVNRSIPASASGIEYFIVIDTSATISDGDACNISVASGTSTYLLGSKQGTVQASA
ncbi:MAG: hypothetical protein J7K00_05280, partial [Candidatus Diapherotrites archaeon]|nr:hypothetical protein [Candidatus Diapherotrites archaeon]